jgi:hypothetical protein
VNDARKFLFVLPLSLFCVTQAPAQNLSEPSTADAGPANGQQTPAPVNPESMSCTALKARLHSQGELSILSGPRGAWGDTFYGPAVPRCQFWQMPQFTYVRTADGLCGIGYICVERLSFD